MGSKSALWANAKQHAGTIVKMPAPPETFETSDIDGLDRQTVMLLHSRGVLVREVNGRPNVWSVNPPCYETAQEYLDDIDVFPCCGSTGFVNRDGDLFCTDCGAPVDPELAREVVA